MNKYFLLIGFITTLNALAVEVKSPDGRLCVDVFIREGRPFYNVTYDNNVMLEDSPLGVETDIGSYSYGMNLGDVRLYEVNRKFSQDRIKRKDIVWHANHLEADIKGEQGRNMTLEMEVSNNDIAFRYIIPNVGGTMALNIEREATGFRFPAESTTFLSSQSDPNSGWKRTHPAYEEYYVTDAPMDSVSTYGHGYTFPALFKIGNEGWVLLSETGVDGYYCASRLSDYKDGIYTVEYPMEEENNYNGSAFVGIALPGKTPWRTITVGKTLEPIVETVVPWAMVEPRYQTLHPACPGRGTWSWILWQDESINYDDQIKFIDLAHEMGYENTLIDAGWKIKIGRDNMEKIFAYARLQGVNPMVWYSSSGYWNDVDGWETNIMDRPITRKKEMKWLRDNGVRGIKVDFFGGDKQETMRIYEDILSDAADYGIDVIFHGCTLPRGWERMYPNFVGAEAVLASENLVFQQSFCDMEAFHATLHPFIRNSVALMEYGGTVLNKRLNRGNDGGTIRKTGDAFQLATSVLFQNPVQNFALAPNNINDAPKEAIEFMKAVPTTWDETEFIDGYPGKYVVLARRNGNKWFVAGVNAQDMIIKLNLNLGCLGVIGKSVKQYYDKSGLQTKRGTIKDDKSYKVEIEPEGGFVIVIE